MESAGKRPTKPPDRLNYQPLQPEILHPSENTMAANDQPTGVTGQSTSRTSPPDNVMLKFMADMRASAALQAKTNAAMHSMKEEMVERFDQCLERWQVVDTRLTKLEDENARTKQQVVNHDEALISHTDRLAILEDEVVTIRSDMARLVLPPNRVNNTVNPTLPTGPTTSFSTCVPPELPKGPNSFMENPRPTSSTLNPTCNYEMMNTTGHGHSSLFGSQERLNDAVSEFSGQNRSVHPESFIRQLDVYFENVPMSAIQQLISVQRRLSGDARMWYDSLIPTPESYSLSCSFPRITVFAMFYICKTETTHAGVAYS